MGGAARCVGGAVGLIEGTFMSIVGRTRRTKWVATNLGSLGLTSDEKAQKFTM